MTISPILLLTKQRFVGRQVAIVYRTLGINKRFPTKPTKIFALNDILITRVILYISISLLSSNADLTQCTSPHFQKTLCNIADTS